MTPFWELLVQFTSSSSRPRTYAPLSHFPIFCAGLDAITLTSSRAGPRHPPACVNVPPLPTLRCKDHKLERGGGVQHVVGPNQTETGQKGVAAHTRAHDDIPGVLLRDPNHRSPPPANPPTCPTTAAQLSPRHTKHLKHPADGTRQPSPLPSSPSPRPSLSCVFPNPSSPHRSPSLSPVPEAQQRGSDGVRD